MTLMITAWLALATAALSPGPNLVAVASRGLGAGRRSALMVTAGLATGAFLWAVLSGVGLGRLFTSFPMAQDILGVVGGAYLIYLGIKGARSALRGEVGQITAAAGHGAKLDFFHGLTVTSTNPKVALLWASLSTFVGPAIGTFPRLMIFAIGSGAVIFTIYGTYGVLFSTGRLRGLYARFQRLCDAGFGACFAALGGILIVRSLM